jgi:hypothetical protein
MMSWEMPSNRPETRLFLLTMASRIVPSVLRLTLAQVMVEATEALVRSYSPSSLSPGGGAVGLFTCQLVKE